jgi:hypothetical protein
MMFAVKVTHLRRVGLRGDRAPYLLTARKAKLVNAEIFPRGGRTIVTLVDEWGEAVARGEARCSDLDNFCRRRGREIALGRAMKKLKPKC